MWLVVLTTCAPTSGMRKSWSHPARGPRHPEQGARGDGDGTAGGRDIGLRSGADGEDRGRTGHRRRRARLAAKVLACMDHGRGDAIGRRARDRILADYAWSSRLALLDDLIERSDLVRQPSSAQAPLRRLVTAPASKG